MKQCERGHIYDETAYTSCPYCAQNGASVRPLDSGFPATTPLNNKNGAGFPATTPLNNGNSASFPATAPLNYESSPNFPPTMPLDPPAAAKSSGGSKKEMSATVALSENDEGVSPVRGWLVIMNGEKKGTSYVIHGEKNVIGRGSNFDVDLSFDKAVSKNGDAVITYDARGKKFFISLAAGKNNIYHNDQLLLTPEEIKEYDVLEIGSTKFVFRSFCNEEFDY